VLYGKRPRGVAVMMRTAVRFVLPVLVASVFTAMPTSPASAHGYWNLTVSYPEIWQGPLWGGIDSYAYFEMSENHYRMKGKLELQYSGGGEWRVAETDIREKFQTNHIRLEVGQACNTTRYGNFIYYRTRLVYLYVWTQSGWLHTSYHNVYRPAGYNLNYAEDCAPTPLT
jgi:hypothetical protein